MRALQYLQSAVRIKREQDAKGGLAAPCEARQQGLRPNALTCTAVNGASIHRGGGPVPERALQPFDEMQQQGLEPNVITHIAVSSACGKCRMPERALRLFNEMQQQQRLEPNVITYTAVIR